MQILLIEDNQGDIQILDIVLSELLTSYKLTVISNGPKAIDYINSFSTSGDGIVPDFIIIDHKLPRSSGLNLLKQIKAQSRLNKVPAFIFTATEDDQIKTAALSIGAEGYFVKPILLNDYIDAVKTMIGMTKQTLAEDFE